MATGPIETHLHRSFNWGNAAPGPQEGPRGRSASCGNGLFAQCVRLRSEINPLLSIFSQSLGYLNSLYKRGALPGWLRDGSSRLLYLSSLAACIVSATLSFVGALVMLNLVKSDMYSGQIKCLLLWCLAVIIMCSFANLVRMAVFAALNTKYAVTGEPKIVGYVNYISEALNKLK